MGASGVDWWQPWLTPLHEWRQAFEHEDWRAALSKQAAERCVCTARGKAIRFVNADDATDGVAYESHIAATGRVPSRDNLHDRFNALIWIAYPRTKAALNARQSDEIGRDGIAGQRGPVRDAATLIDESGLLLASDAPDVFGALRSHQWQLVLVDERARWGRSIVPLAFGHALLDKLCGPFKSITAAVVPLPLGDGSAEAIDAAAAAFVQRAELAPRDLLHLPVLGIPGWWPPNENPRFYDDAHIFRSALSP